MTVRALGKPKTNDPATLSPVFGRKPSGKSLYRGPAIEGRDPVNLHFGHNFGDVRVDDGQSFEQSCPFAPSGPTYCSFGGACHTFAPRVQTKLKIGQPGDEYEQEADRVAEQVMHTPEPQVQRKGCSCCSGADEEELIQAKSIAGRITPLIQRSVEEEEKEEEDDENVSLQPKEVPGQTPAVTKGVQRNINSLRGKGKPLSESRRSFFEQGFGHDFSQVRVHSGAQAARLARAVNARAFTVDRDVVFGAGQYAPETDIGQRLLAHELTHVVQQTSSMLPSGSRLQRQGGSTSASPEPASEEMTTSTVIIDDEAAVPGGGQMRKDEFLRQLRSRATGAADAAMASTGRTTADCPYLDYWFSYYENQDSAHIERALHRYAPETRNSTTAEEYIAIATEQVRRAAQTWAETGRITGVPEWILAAAPGGAPSEGGEDIEASSAPVMAKAHEGGVRSADNPRAIQAELGQGLPLDSGIRSRMESAFGTDFSHVRTHTDPTASNLSKRLNARAFTVGEHVAFRSGEYKPGTILGDALIAHEMAHVVQQSNASASIASMQTGEAGYDKLEEDADESAVSMLASLWSSAKGFAANVAGNITPALRSGLRLQRCDDCGSSAEREAERRSGPKRPEAQEEAPPAPPEQQREEPQAEPEEPGLPPLAVTGTNRLVPNTPASGCIPTAGEGADRTSNASFDVQYEKTYRNRFEITLRDRDDNDAVLHTAAVDAGEPDIGQVTIPSGIPIRHEAHHYELEMIFYNSRGRAYGGLRPRPAVKFEVCRLEPAPSGEHLLFAKAIYGEGEDAGEFPYVRDIVYNRIDWVAGCPGDAGDFGTDITTVLNRPRQFASVLENTDKFQQLEIELNTRSGDCGYTTAPRSGNPNICRLVNSAIRTEAAGDGNTHEYVFFRSDRRTPSNRAVNPPWHYPGGNYYWRIRNCPPDRQRRR